MSANVTQRIRFAPLLHSAHQQARVMWAAVFVTSQEIGPERAGSVSVLPTGQPGTGWSWKVSVIHGTNPLENVTVAEGREAQHEDAVEAVALAALRVADPLVLWRRNVGPGMFSLVVHKEGEPVDLDHLLVQVDAMLAIEGGGWSDERAARWVHAQLPGGWQVTVEAQNDSS